MALVAQPFGGVAWHPPIGVPLPHFNPGGPIIRDPGFGIAHQDPGIGFARPVPLPDPRFPGQGFPPPSVYRALPGPRPIHPAAAAALAALRAHFRY